MLISTKKRTRRPRDPEGTREAILEAAGTQLAKVGPEGLSVSEVAHLAGVNRGTAYQHFESREKLVKATAEWVSEKLYRRVFGLPPEKGERPVEQVDVAGLTDRLADFAMDNPALCQGWLLQVLASPDPSADIFWREYEGSLRRFAATKLARAHIDTEVLSVVMLAGTFLWPVWARAHAKSAKERRKLSRRLAQECLRLSMYGSMQPEFYPEIASRLAAAIKPSKLRSREN
jgi:AcrR family transcriptional regulator